MRSPPGNPSDKGRSSDWRAGCAERCLSGSGRGRWKSARKGNSLAAYFIE